MILIYNEICRGWDSGLRYFIYVSYTLWAELKAILFPIFNNCAWDTGSGGGISYDLWHLALRSLSAFWRSFRLSRLGVILLKTVWAQPASGSISPTGSVSRGFNEPETIGELCFCYPAFAPLEQNPALLRWKQDLQGVILAVYVRKTHSSLGIHRGSVPASQAHG